MSETYEQASKRMRLPDFSNLLPELYDAVMCDNIDRVIELMYLGAVLNFSIGEAKMNPLVAALNFSSIEMVRFLIRNGANPLAPTANELTGLHNLVSLDREGFETILEELLEAYPEMDRNLPGPSRWTPLHYAANRGRADYVRILCEHGASPYLQSVSGNTPLSLAAERCYPDVVAMLLEYGASANQVGHHFKPPLYHAVYTSNLHDSERSLKTCELLVSAGADVNVKSENGPSVLHMAVALGKEEIVSLLVEHGADLSYVNHSGYDALAVARTYEWPTISDRLERVQLVLNDCRGGNFKSLIQGIEEVGGSPVSFKQLRTLPVEVVAQLKTIVDGKVAMEVATFSALFSETVDDETSYQTEVEGPVAQELAAVNVSPCAETRRTYRALSAFLNA
jgi:ankyrin repeat protein